MTFPLQEQYVNILTDFGFKRVFGLEPNKQLLMDFLNTLLPEHHPIQTLSYKSTENLGSTPDDLVPFKMTCFCSFLKWQRLQTLRPVSKRAIRAV